MLSATDPQPARRLLHVCPDAAAGDLVAAAARSARLDFVRADDAFAAAVELIRCDGNALLLVALDFLANVETPLLAWAAARWPNIALWAHGSAARLDGQLAQARVKLVALPQLARLLADYAASDLASRAGEADAASRAGPGLAPDIPVTPTTDSRDAETSEQPPHAPPTPDGHDPTARSRNVPVEEASSLEPGPASSAADQPQPDAGTNSVSTPALRLHPPVPPGRPLLTPEELAALLGPEGIHGG